MMRIRLAILAVLLLPFLLGALTDDLVSWWSFDGSNGTVDLAGGNDVSSVGTATQVAGVIGNAYDFGGATSLTVPDDATLDLTGDFTFAFWARFDNLTATSSILVKSGSYTIAQDADDQDITVTLAGLGTATFVDMIPDVSYHHYAFTRNGGTIEGFLDGASVGTGTVAGAIPVTGNILSIGLNLDGRMDDVRIWSGVVSDGDILALATQSLQGQTSVAQVTTFFTNAFSTLGLSDAAGAGLVITLVFASLFLGVRNMWFALVVSGMLLIGFVLGGFIPPWVMALPTLGASFIIVTRLREVLS